MKYTLHKRVELDITMPTFVNRVIKNINYSINNNLTDTIYDIVGEQIDLITPIENLDKFDNWEETLHVIVGNMLVWLEEKNYGNEFDKIVAYMKNDKGLRI